MNASRGMPESPCSTCPTCCHSLREARLRIERLEAEVRRLQESLSKQVIDKQPAVAAPGFSLLADIHPHRQQRPPPEMVERPQVVAGVEEVTAKMVSHWWESRARREVSGDRSARAAVVAELIETEEVFLRALRIIVGVFLNPLRAACGSSEPIIEADDIAAIFCQIEPLVSLHGELHGALVEVRGWLENGEEAEELVAEVFLRFLPFFKLHIPYAANYLNAVARMNLLQASSPRFAEFLIGCKHIEPQFPNLDMEGFLIMPVQRIPRYLLLLRDLLRLSPSAASSQSLRSVVTSLETIGGQLNQSIGFHNDQTRFMMEILPGLTSRRGLPATWASWQDLIQPHRRFICSEEIVKLTSKGPQPTNFLLFNDFLLWGTSAYGWTYTLGSLDLRCELLSAVPLPFSMPSDYPLRLLSPRKEWTLLFPSEAARQKWALALQACIQEQAEFHHPGPPSSGFEASSSSWADDDFEISSDDPAAQTLPPSPVTPDMTNRLSKWRFVTKLSKIFTPD